MRSFHVGTPHVDEHKQIDFDQVGSLESGTFDVVKCIADYPQIFFSLGTQRLQTLKSDLKCRE